MSMICSLVSEYPDSYSLPGLCGERVAVEVLKMNQLSAEQLNALRCFAAQYGRRWKSELRDCWMTGNYPSDCDSAALQNVRNAFGPSWLVRFRLPEVAA